MSLRWRGSIVRRSKEVDSGHHATPNRPVGRRIEIELGVKAISGLPPSPLSPSEGDSSHQPTVCVTWRKNGKLAPDEDKRRQREGTSLPARVGFDGTCCWDDSRITVIPCHIRKYDSDTDAREHKTVSFYVNQVVGSRTKRLKKVYEATLDLNRCTLYPTCSEEHLVLRPLSLRRPSHDIAWLLVQVRVLTFKALPSVPPVLPPPSPDKRQVNPRDIPIVRSQSGTELWGKAARRISQQLMRVRSMPGEEGKPKESQGEADGEYEDDGEGEESEADRAERDKREKEEAERYIQLYLHGYKEKQHRLQQSQDQVLVDSKSSALSPRHQQVPSNERDYVDEGAPRHQRDREEDEYEVKIAHYERMLQEMQETRDQMHHEIDQLVGQLEETKRDAARLLQELEQRETSSHRDGGEEGPDEPLRTRESEEMARMVDDLRALIIEREDQLVELRHELCRHVDEIEAIGRDREREKEAMERSLARCQELSDRLEANEREREEIRDTLAQEMDQTSALHEELRQKERQLAELEEKLREEVNEKSATLQRRDRQEWEEQERRRQEVEELRAVIEDHQRSIDELTLKLETKRIQNAEFVHRIAELEGAMEEKQRELNEMTRSRNTLHQRIEEMEADRQREMAEREAKRIEKEKEKERKATQAAQTDEPSLLPNGDKSERRLMHELSEAKRQLRHKRQEVADLDRTLAEMTNSSRASESQVAAWEHQLHLCRRRIAELGGHRRSRDRSNVDTNTVYRQDNHDHYDDDYDDADADGAERGRVVAECEADMEVLRLQVMAELEKMREIAQQFARVKQQREEAVIVYDRLAQAVSAIKQRILAGRKRAKERRMTTTLSMMVGHRDRPPGAQPHGTEMTNEQQQLLLQDWKDSTAQEIRHLHWEIKAKELIERHIWNYDPAKRQPATAETAVKEIMAQLQVFQPRHNDQGEVESLACLTHGLMSALSRSHKRAGSAMEEQIHWLSFASHLLHVLKNDPDSAAFFHPAVFYSVPDPAEGGVSITKVKFRLPDNKGEGEAEQDQEMPTATYTSFLWLQKLHNLVLRIYSSVVKSAYASVEPVIAALMQQQQPPPASLKSSSSSSSSSHSDADHSSGQSSESSDSRGHGHHNQHPTPAPHEAEVGIRMLARSTRETLRGLGFLKAKIPETLTAAVEEDHVTAKCVKQLKGIVESLFELLMAEGVFDSMVIQLCKQVFHFLDVSLFNAILTGNEHVRSAGHALKIKYFLSQVVDWCLHDFSTTQDQNPAGGEEEAITLAEVLQLSCTFLERHTAEATSLLVMDKERIVEEGNNLRSLFSHLNTNQIIHLLEQKPTQAVTLGHYGSGPQAQQLWQLRKRASGLTPPLRETPRWMMLLSRLAVASNGEGDLNNTPGHDGTSAQPLAVPLLSFKTLP